MCNTHQHTKRAEAAVLDRPAQKGWSSAALPGHTRAGSVSTLPPPTQKEEFRRTISSTPPPPVSKPAFQPPRLQSTPVPPPTQRPQIALPQRPAATAKPVVPAKPAVVHADPALAGHFGNLIAEAYTERKSIAAANNGNFTKGDEKRWQAATLERTYKLLFPGEPTRPDYFDGERKGQTLSKVTAKLRELRIEMAKVPSFMGGSRMF